MIYKSSPYFLPSFQSTGLLVQEKKFKIDLQDGSHLGFLTEMILAIFNLHVTLILPTKTPKQFLSECFFKSMKARIMSFQTPTARTGIHKGSFFPQTIRDWNVLPDLIITSAKGAEDGVARFISLVRARDPMANECH